LSLLITQGLGIKQKNRKKQMTLKINDTAPDFEAETTQGKINLYDWAKDSWIVLFSHPKNFTPVCTTELGALQSHKGEFDKRNVKILGLSVDPVEDHGKWSEDIKDVTGFKPEYPLIGDKDLTIAKAYGMLPASTEGFSDERTAADNATVRNVFVIGPDKKIKLILSYPMATGRNFLEILRVIDSLQLTAKHKVATPANWKQGEDVIIVPTVKEEEAKTLFPDGWNAVKPYLRIVKQPKILN
jgi:alkyl hydroperoxide reductase subunit AhpC